MSSQSGCIYSPRVRAVKLVNNHSEPGDSAGPARQGATGAGPWVAVGVTVGRKEATLSPQGGDRTAHGTEGRQQKSCLDTIEPQMVAMRKFSKNRTRTWVR